MLRKRDCVRFVSVAILKYKLSGSQVCEEPGEIRVLLYRVTRRKGK